MILDAGDSKYEWIDNWAVVVDNESGRSNGRTHGVAETSNGNIVVFCQAEPSVLFFDSGGKLVDSWGSYLGAHGLTLVVEDGVDYLWLTDQDTKEVVKTTLDGKIVQEIKAPEHPVYLAGGNYIPTWAAVNEVRYGGNGDIWTADGYGSSLVHHFDKDAKYIDSLDGTTGAGRFACPHGIFFDNRSTAPRLLVADRGNHRIQSFDPDGAFVESFGEEYLVHPDCFSTHEGRLLVPELYGRVALVDNSNHLVAYLGRNDSATETVGWPNLSKTQLTPGLFSSPHGGTFASSGDIYIVEWIIGGRITKLAKLP